MSTGPHASSPDPFDQNRRDPNTAGETAEIAGGERKKKGCLIGCLVFGVLTGLICCGGGIYLMNAGFGILSEDYESQFVGHPLIEEHVGEIVSFTPNWSQTFEEGRNAGEEGRVPLAFDVKGTKGDVVILVLQEEQGPATEIESATMVLPDGTRLPMELEPGANNVGDIDVDALEDLDMMIDMGVEDAAPPADTAPPEEAAPAEQADSDEPSSEDEASDEEASDGADDSASHPAVKTGAPVLTGSSDPGLADGSAVT